jgi:chorismate mutase
VPRAEAHKAAILEFRAELDKLTAAGTLDRLVPLEDQYRLHPERRQIVQSAWDRVSAGEQAALAKAQADGSSMLDKEYQFAFQLIRGEAAQRR